MSLPSDSPSSCLSRRAFVRLGGLGAAASVLSSTSLPGAAAKADLSTDVAGTPPTLASERVKDFNAHDQRIWEEELEAFVPRRIFDAHAHLFWHTNLPAGHPGGKGWWDTDHAAHQAWARRLYPGREVHYLFLGAPLPGINVEAHNQFIHGELAKDPQSRGNLLVTPACTPDYIAATVKQKGFIGLKPYRMFTTGGNPHTCRIKEFFPESQMEVANELGLWVTMHVSRFAAVADPDNMRDLQEYTLRRYPRIKWILAHCGRSFTYWQIREAIARLRDLPNIFYDLAAVCDLRPILTLFKGEDVRRIFFGSDGTSPMFVRGAYMAQGRSWAFVSPTAFLGKQENAYANECGPILAIYENLLSIKQAADIAGFGRGEVEAIFWKNAVREFGVSG
ncbi:MAG: hypothetical protein EXS39_02635 [Opitutaceae bacterium]|nr:hypothetical protein [Opitutaceae bacterium]